MKTQILEDDILSIDEYIKNRDEIKKNISLIKKTRRMQVGPHANFYFECYETMLYQIQEMIFIERGGKEQLLDELNAYNPLVPKGNELVTTLMFEIPNEVKRKDFLHTIGGIEEDIYIEVNGEKIFAKPEGDTERTNEKGKASSVHFLHFYFNENQISLFKDLTTKAIIGFSHSNYQHLAIFPNDVRNSLIRDFS